MSAPTTPRHWPDTAPALSGKVLNQQERGGTKWAIGGETAPTGRVGGQCPWSVICSTLGDMWEALVGGLFALLAGWLAVGGRERRMRAAIKEELEIIQLLDAGHPDRADLEGRLDGRLSRYLRPPDIEKVTWQGLVFSAVIALVLLQVWPQVGPEPTSGLGQTLLGMGTGALAVLLAAGGRLAYVMAVPEKRAAFLRVVRDADSDSSAPVTPPSR